MGFDSPQRHNVDLSYNWDVLRARCRVLSSSPLAVGVSVPVALSIGTRSGCLVSRSLSLGLSL